MSNNFKYFDSHTHVQFAAYKDDFRDVMKRALEADIGVVNVGTKKQTSESAIRIAEEFPNAWAAIGIHPIHANKSFHDDQEISEDTPHENSFDEEFYTSLANHEKVVAIGECGLDYFHTTSSNEKKNQKKIFEKQITLADKVQKPLMIHCRDAYKDLLEILKASNVSVPQIIHFFSGTIDEAKKFLEMDFYFTFGGAITLPPKKNGTDYEKVVSLVPMEKILTETDAPYVAPMSKRGKRNEPLNIPEIVEKLAEIKKIKEEEMRIKVLENAGRVFNLF